jgi:hypothetical protein
MKQWQKAGLILLALGTPSLLIIFMNATAGERAFKRHFGSPIPSSIQALQCEWREWGQKRSKMVGHLSFSGSKEDLQTLAAQFETISANEMHLRLAPQWFRPALMSTNGPFYRRKGKRGPEYLWIDPSGTNAYFLTFGV